MSHSRWWSAAATAANVFKVGFDKEKIQWDSINM
jgi:hypothetical protein